MIDISKGKYWDEGIQLVDGCTPCSPGCDHCWSAAQAKRFHPYIIEGDNAMPLITDKGNAFNGRIEVHPDRLKRFNTRKPKVFAIWNDLFHEDVPRQFIDDVVCCMARYSHNIYLALTKRPYVLYEWADSTNGRSDYLKTLENLYLGLTVCNQAEADKKIPIFLQVPGKKFLSIEPMLGPIKLFGAFGHWEDLKPDRLTGLKGKWIYEGEIASHIDSVILGGETGTGARPLHPDWVRSVRDQCSAAGVPFFFKSWGNYWKKRINHTDNGVPIAVGNGDTRILDGCFHNDLPWVKA